MEINKFIRDLKKRNVTIGNNNKSQKKNQKDGGNFKKTYKNNKGAEKLCYRCHMPGHFACNCRMPEEKVNKIEELKAQIKDIKAVYGVTNEEMQDF